LDLPEQLRLFVALSVPEGVKDSIFRAQEELRRALAERSARWTRREQFHLTIRFLGNVRSDQTTELVDSARTACRDFEPLSVTAKGIGVFPNMRSPRVLWVGVDNTGRDLARLWASIQRATQPFTEQPAEPGFTGHVTLARINRITRPQKQALKEHCSRLDNTEFGTWKVDRLELVRSELLPQGARHSVVAELPLPDHTPTK
jgi:RNA 2',3'-cyclic 3'-phosphodiesterase